GYIGSQSENKDLVRFKYADKEDMFDAVSYNKGGRILKMLRDYVGDSAFYKALNVYLTTNKFKSAEVHQLRLAMEEVTGKDLNWFFNQWYFGSGHPKLDINYSYNESQKKAIVVVRQTQASGKVFTLPVDIDVYVNGKKERHSVWVKNKVDSFSFEAAAKPSLVNFDGRKYLLAEKKENKDLDEYIYQYTHAGTYVDRREAIDFAAKNQSDPKAVVFLSSTLKDPYFGLRNYTLGKLDMTKDAVKKETESTIYQIALKDPKTTVRAKAISLLTNFNKPAYKALFIKSVNDQSYSVAGEPLDALATIDSAAAIKE